MAQPTPLIDNDYNLYFFIIEEEPTYIIFRDRHVKDVDMHVNGMLSCVPKQKLANDKNPVLCNLLCWIESRFDQASSVEFIYSK